MMKIILGLFAAYVLFVALLYFAQRSMLYFPNRFRPLVPVGGHFVRVGDVEGWYLSAEEKDRVGPVILFFHGNGGHHGHRLHKARYYVEAGYDVLLAGYPGYGGNAGKSSEQAFYAAGRAYMDWLKRVAPDRKIVLYGESIGSGTAVQMAMEYDVTGLILETPFSSLVDVAAAHYPFVPVRLLLKDRYENDQKIEKINAPLLILHGHKDRIIPLSSAQKLFHAAQQPKKFVDFPQGNHNNLYAFGAAPYVLDFLEQIVFGQSHDSQGAFNPRE